MATLVRTGGILSFFVVTLADRVGRKNVIANTVLCYAFFTLLTALSSGMVSFTLFQSSSQVFLAAEFGLAVTIICEEFPDEMRGRAISILHTVAFVGVTIAGILYGYVAQSSFGWRGMYLSASPRCCWSHGCGAGCARPPVSRPPRQMRVTQGMPRASIFAPIRQCMGRWRGLSLAPVAGRRAYATASVWSAARPFRSSASTPSAIMAGPRSQVGTAFVLAYVMGSAGTLLSGLMLDRIGRRFTTALFYLRPPASRCSPFSAVAAISACCSR